MALWFSIILHTILEYCQIVRGWNEELEIIDNFLNLAFVILKKVNNRRIILSTYILNL